MKEQFVSYSIALKLKELGFNEHCFGMYCQHGDLQNINLFTSNDPDNISKRSSFKLICIAPLWQQVIDWFREEHNINLYLPKSVYGGYVYVVDSKYSDTIYKDYYDAREQAILKAIELCQKEK